MDQGQVVKLRPAELELATPSFQPTVVSSAANKFIQKVDARVRYSWAKSALTLF